MPLTDRALSQTVIVADHERRLRRARTQPHDLPFSYPGALTVSTSPPWTPRQNVELNEVRCLLGTAGTSDTVVTVYKNGTSIGTVTVPSGEVNVAAAFATQLFANTDLLTVGVTTAGVDATDLVVIARF